MSDRLRSDTSLWKLLRNFEETGVGKHKGLNLTARGIPGGSGGGGVRSGSGQLYWEAPVLRIAGRELSSLADLQKTLSQVGIDAGSQLILVEFRATDTTLQEAMRSVDQYFSETDADALKAPPTTATTQAQEVKTESVAAEEPQKAPASPPQQPQPGLAAEASPVGPPPVASPAATPQEAATADSEPPANEALTSSSSLQPLEVWTPSASSTPAAAQRSEPETDFAPSVAQLKAHQAHLQAGTSNRRLRSDAEVAADRAAAAARQAAVRRVDIRVRFPDGHVARWAFGPDATGATLHAAVRAALARPDELFKLALPAGGGDIRDAAGPRDGLIAGHGLRGGVVVTLITLDDGGASARDRAFLKQGVLSRAHEVVVPDVPETDVVEEDVQPAPARAEAGGRDPAKGTGRPKWFKFGKK